MEEGTTSLTSTLGKVAREAGWKALGSGGAGALAMVVNVTALMWLRTLMNYQYRHGTGSAEAFRALWKEGGWARFYQGYWASLAQAPLARFGDTAANGLMLGLLEGTPLPTPTKTLAASLSVGLFRMALMPVDAVKTSLQVEGSKGLSVLMDKVNTYGVGVLWHGAMATSAASIVGHFPWFAVFNFLNANWPKYGDALLLNLLRSAAIGFVCSIISDTLSNCIRVIKTMRQTYERPLSYTEAVRMVVAKDGLLGLFGRGLQTRLLANGLQGLLFTVMWRYLSDVLFAKRA